jgi:FixJ family two-component response regulator
VIFIVDDDYAVRDCLGCVIETAGFACQCFESAEHFLQTYSRNTLDCLLLDVNMPGMNGLELQDEISRRNICLPIIFISSEDDEITKTRAIKAGAFDFLTKPVMNQHLIECIQAALKN